MEILWWIGITGVNKVNEGYIDGVIWFIAAIIKHLIPNEDRKKPKNKIILNKKYLIIPWSWPNNP